jgi:predicted nucleic acid-binding protein
MLLDTSGLFALMNPKDEYHVLAKSLYGNATLRVTHSYVLAEFVPLAHVRKLPRADVLSVVTDLLDDPTVHMIWVDEHLHRAATNLLNARSDKNYSLCDAVSFVVLKERSLTASLTTDHHFEQEGFQKLLTKK